MKTKKNISEYLREKRERKKRQKIKREKGINNLDNIALWASYYRLFPHLFVRDYMNINLRWFQVILIYAMQHFPYFMYIASRGQGKNKNSWQN